MSQLNKVELEVQELLQSELKPDEELLAFTQGKAGSKFYIGLTKERLILLPVERQEDSSAINIRRDAVKALNSSWIFATLKVKFPGEQLSIRCDGPWRNRARNIAQIHYSTPVPSETSESVTSNADHLQQVQDFRRLDLLNSAEAALKRAVKLDPALKLNPDVRTLHQELKEKLLALRVGGGLLISTWLILSGLALADGSRPPFFSGLFGLVGYHLWRRRARWRVTGLRVGLGLAVLYAWADYTVFGLLDALLWLPFGAAVTLALTGQAQRKRTATAAILYVTGFIGILNYWFLEGLVSPLLEGG
jgi:hypothetical protein